MSKILLLVISVLVALNLQSAPTTAVLFSTNPSIVKVHVANKDGNHGVGSGVVVAKDYIVTNCHVIADAQGVHVEKYGVSYPPEALIANWKNDLCILKFDNLPLPSVNLRPSKDLSYEEKVFSLTFPNDNPMPLPSYGKIKALYPFQKSHIIRSSAGFTVGSSGGALFDLDFNLVGITTFKSPGRREGYYYCLPTEWIKELLETKEQINLKSNAAPFWSLPEDQKPFFMRVVLPMQNEDWPLMLKITKSWTQADKENADAWYYLGFAQRKMMNLDFAKLFLKQALKLNNMHLDSLTELIEISIEQKNKIEFNKVVNLISKIDESLATSYLDNNSL